MTTHYRIDTHERQIKLGSTGHFEPAPLCGSGDGHAQTTRTPEHVDCSACNTILTTQPAYLDLSRPLSWEIHGHVYSLDEEHGAAPVYTVWTDGEIYQITNGMKPLNAAGYGNLEALLKLKNINPIRFRGDEPAPLMRP